MSFLKITPYDTLFFRDGKPFEKNTSNYLKSLKIPYPTTFHGAIFTALLSQNDEFRAFFIRKKAHEKKRCLYDTLKIKHVLLYEEYNKHFYIRSPKDIYISSNKVKMGTLKKVKSTDESHYLKYLEEPIGDFERCDHHFVNLYNFNSNYTNDFFKTINFLDETDVFYSEYFTRVQLNYGSKTSEEGQLFTIEQVGFKNNDFKKKWSYLVEYEIDDKYLSDIGFSDIRFDRGHLKLGGEAKVCRYESIDLRGETALEIFDNHQKDQAKAGTMIKVVFTTDVIFSSIKWNAFFELESLITSKPIFFGGFDLAEGKAKRMQSGYGAGTVLLLRVKQDISSELGNYLESLLTANYTNGFNRFMYFIVNEGVVYE